MFCPAGGFLRLQTQHNSLGSSTSDSLDEELYILVEVAALEVLSDAFSALVDFLGAFP